MEYLRCAAVFLVISKFFQVFITRQENQKYIRGFASILTIGIILTPISNIDFNDILKKLDKNIEQIQDDNQQEAMKCLQQYMDKDEKSKYDVEKTEQNAHKIDLFISRIKITVQKIVIPDIKINTKICDSVVSDRYQIN